MRILIFGINAIAAEIQHVTRFYWDKAGNEAVVRFPDFENTSDSYVILIPAVMKQISIRICCRMQLIDRIRNKCRRCI
jgi:hypothetical protein